MKLENFREVARLVAVRGELIDMHSSLFGRATVRCHLVPHSSPEGINAEKHCEPYWLRNTLADHYKSLIADTERQLTVLGVVIE